jgi:hypothetical protein
MERAYLSEVELAMRWDLSPKTLQRWRTDGRGPHYLKLSKSVRYPIEEVMIFENKSLRDSTSSRPTDIFATYGDDLLSMKQIAQATGLPMYIFSNMKIREGLKVPHTKVQKLLRFSFTEVRNWAFALFDGNAPMPLAFVNTSISHELMQAVAKFHISRVDA